MADQTTERKTTLPQEREVVDFIASGIDYLSDSMARFSVSPTPDAILRIEEAALVAEADEAIARALSAVEVSDPNFANLDLSEDAADAYAITIAKAKAAEEQVQNFRVKEALGNFRDRILNSAGRAIGQIGGKKALTATAGLSLVVAACGPLISPQPQEISGDLRPASVEATPADARATSIPEKIAATITPTEEPIPLEAILMLQNLGEGFASHKEGEQYVVTNNGEPFARIPQQGLEVKYLENGNKIYSGVEVQFDSETLQNIPEGSEFVLDSLGHISVLNGERIIGVYHENKLVIMPGLERWGADELQVAIIDSLPRVVSLRGTELYRYMDGEWRSVLQPGLSTYFVNRGQAVTTGHFLVENTPPQARTNVGEFGKNAQAVILFDNPEPYIYDNPLNDVYDEVVVEGVILSPDGRPSLIRLPLAPSDKVDGIWVFRRSDITGGAQALRVARGGELIEMTVDEYVELISRKVYGYVFMEFGLIEGKIHPDYINHPVYELHRKLESTGRLDFLEDSNKPSPYVMPLRVMSLVLDGEEQ